MLSVLWCAALSLSPSLPTAAAFAPRARAVACAPAAAGDAPSLAAGVASPAAAELLWASAGKPLLRVGSKGALPSHANGLADLCAGAPFVCVRLTGSNTGAALSDLVELSPGAPLAAGPGRSPVLLATRRPRKGGVEALFAQQARVDEVCGDSFHAALAEREEREALEAVQWAEERAASAAKSAAKAERRALGRERVKVHRPPKAAPRAPPPVAMAKGYCSEAELHAAVRAHLASLPAGAAEDESLPSALSYNELNYRGRADLVEGCMAFGGYLKVSAALGVPVRIGVERASDDDGAPKPAAGAAKKVASLFNLFGNAG